MSIIGSNILAGASGQGGGYQISRSVRTRSSATAYFNRTPASAGNRTTFTWSGWVKRGGLTGNQNIFGPYTNSTGSGTYGVLRFVDGNLAAFDYTNGTINWQLATTAVYRDPSAWYHIVFAVDTNQATASNRLKIYINGVQVTDFTTATYPSINYQGQWNNALIHYISTTPVASQYFDGYLTEMNFIDGLQLTPSSFGSINAATGVWQPIKYTGTYGTNGFYLNFSDNSSNTATTIGKDNSGNGNNWTPNNISVTAGVTYDSMLDVPTLYADTGNGRGNYCVLNPLYIAGGGTFANGNLQVVTGTSTAGRAISTMGILSGKWYWEITPTSIPAGGVSIGVVPIPTTNDSGTVGNNASEYGYLSGGTKFNNSTSTAYGASYIANDVIGIALDLDGGTITFYKNNTSQGTAFSSITATTYIPAVSDTSSSDTATLVANFGQRPFTYTPPTGFVALNTQNLPTPTISNGANYMAATTYTGTNATASISNAVNSISFQPDWVWIKSRSTTGNNGLVDSVRGNYKVLYSNLTLAEETNTAGTGVTAFSSNGFTLGTDPTTSANMNANGTTYVAWQWKAGTTSASNTSGTITSTVSVNATAGFSVVTYTGTGANATVGHGLGVAPKMIIVKHRNAIDGWVVYHSSLTSAAYYLLLNDTAAQTLNSTVWNSTAPTSSVFSVGTITNTNQSTGTYVAYCFASVAGYSAFGSYAGNNSTDGPFVYCGFRPRFVLIKNISSAVALWEILDTSRDTYNPAGYELYPNLSSAEGNASGAGGDIDFLSNGFKLRRPTTELNVANTYIYACFAENPFKLSLAR